MGLTMLALFAYGIAFLLPYLLHWYSQPRTEYIYTRGTCSNARDKDGKPRRDGKIKIKTSRGTFFAFVERWRVRAGIPDELSVYVLLVKKPFRALAVERLAFGDAGTYINTLSSKGLSHTTYYFLLAFASIFGFYVKVLSFTEGALLYLVAIYFALSVTYAECCYQSARYFQRVSRKKD